MNSLLLIGVAPLFFAVVQSIFGVVCIVRGGRNNRMSLDAGLSGLVAGLFCASVGIFYMRASMGLDGGAFFYRFAWVLGFLIPLNIDIAVTMRKKVTKFTRWAPLLLYPFWAVVLVLNLATDLVDIEPISILPYIDRGGWLEEPIRHFAAVQIIFLIYQLIMAYRESVGVKRQQSAYFILGASIFAIGVLAFVIPYGDNFYLDPGLACYLSFPWIALTIYAVARHRLFDIRMVLSKILSAVLLTAGFAGFHIGIFEFFRRLVGVDTGIVIATIITAIVGFTSPFVGYVRKLTTLIFFRKTVDYQASLKQSSAALASILNLDDLVRKFIEIARTNIGVHNAGFYLVNESSHALHYGIGTPADNPTKPLHAVIEWLTKTKQAFVGEELSNTMFRHQFKMVDLELESIGGELVVPVFYKETLSGFLVLGGKLNRDSFFQDDISFLETLSSQIALGIENSRLFAEATTDGLTGLYHQKYFKARLHSEFIRSKRHEHTLVLLLIDIDFFKKINDTYGHLTGDSVLRDVAKIINTSFRIEDLVARYGGEEFAVLLTEPHTNGAYEAAERIRKKVEKHAFEKGIKVTVSIGMRVMDGKSPCDTDLDLIESTDASLYAAKHGGRNQVVVHGVTPTKLKRIV